MFSLDPNPKKGNMKFVHVSECDCGSVMSEECKRKLHFEQAERKRKDAELKAKVMP